MADGPNIGDFFNGVGAKLGQFGHWLGDVTGANGAKQVDPYQLAPGTQAPGMDFGQSQEDRANQMALYQQLQQMAAGNGPSLAQGQLQQATDQNINQSMALGAAQQGQGLGYASALRNIGDQGAQARQQAAAQSAMIRNAEQMQAMQGMGNLSGQMRQQDMGQVGMGQQNAQFYGGLNANIDAQNAAGRRQLTGNVLNALGGGIPHMLGFGGGGGGGGGNSGMLSGGDTASFNNGTPNYSTGGQVGCGPGMYMGGQTGGVPDRYSSGGPIDSPRNDTVRAMLSPGEIVLPRSVTMAPDAAERARLFVQQVQQRAKRGPPKVEHHLVEQARRKAA